jgi:hypothetical protein
MTTAVYDTPAAKMRDPVQRLAYWINERQRITDNRAIDEPKPWTQDPILQRFKFCCVQREDDRVTRWIDANWRKPHDADPNAWFAMCVARLINWPDTLHAIGYPLRWDAARAARAMHARAAQGAKVFTGAYMVTSGGQSGSKIDYIVSTLTQTRKLADPPRRGDTLRQAHAKLVNAPGLGSFMAAQVVADLKHMALLREASDWMDWAAPGPGSLRGLARITGKRVNNQDAFIIALQALRKDLMPLLGSHVDDQCLQDLQNCLCEFDKYERTLWGEGRPRSHYPGVA